MEHPVISITPCPSGPCWLIPTASLIAARHKTCSGIIPKAGGGGVTLTTGLCPCSKRPKHSALAELIPLLSFPCGSQFPHLRCTLQFWMANFWEKSACGMQIRVIHVFVCLCSFIGVPTLTSL